MIITDEMVGIAENAYDKVGTFHTGCETSALRAALEAVAPMLIAQLMRDAANGTLDEETIRTIAARARELDPVIRNVLDEVSDCAQELEQK